MTYEHDVARYTRQQVRKGYASNTIVYFPTVPGIGEVDVTGSPTYALYRPGDSIGSSSPFASGSVTPTASGSIEKLLIPVDASLLELNEYYQCLVSFVYSGTTYQHVVYFDCATFPWLPLVTANDLVAEVSDMESRLTAQATRMESGRTAEQQAAVLGAMAWADVQMWLAKTASDLGRILPQVIIDTEAVRRVVAALAVSKAYKAEGGGPDSESFALCKEWHEEAQRRYASMPPLRYDANQDGSGDTYISGWSVATVGRDRW